MVVKLVNKDDVLFFGDLDGSYWTRVPTIVPGGIGEAIEIDFASAGQIVNDPPLTTAIVLKDSFNYFKKNSIILEGYLLGTMQMAGDPLKGFFNFNFFAKQPFLNSASLAISISRDSPGYFSVNGLSSDLQTEDYWQKAWQYNENIPKFKFIVRHEIMGLRKTIYYFDEYTQNWALVWDSLCTPDSDFYVNPTTIEKHFLEIISATSINAPSFFKYTMDSLVLKTTAQPVVPITYESSNLLVDFSTGNWQDYGNLLLLQAGVDSTAWQNKIVGNLVVEPGGHFFDTSLPRITINCEPNYTEDYFFDTCRYYDDPSKRNYRVTIPFYFTSEFYIENYMSDQLYGGEPYTINASYNGSGIDLFFLYNMTNIVVPNALVGPLNTWYYLQFEILQNDANNIISIGIGKEINSYAPEEFIHPVSLQNIVIIPPEFKKVLHYSFYFGGDGPTFKTTGWFIELF